MSRSVYGAASSHVVSLRKTAALSRLVGDVDVVEAPVARLLPPRPVVGSEEGAVVVEQVGLARRRVRATEVELACELAVRVLRGGRADGDRDGHDHVLAAAVQDDRAVIHAVGSVGRDVHRRRERTARDRGRGHPRPVDIVVEVDPDLEVRDRNRLRPFAVLQAEEDAVRRACRRVADERLKRVRACPVVHEADVLALVHLGPGEVQVEIAVDLRALREHGVVDDAVAVGIRPEVAVAVLVGPVVGEETPGLVGRVVPVGIELVARIVRPHDHQVGVRVRLHQRREVDEVIRRVEVVLGLLVQVGARERHGLGRRPLHVAVGDRPRPRPVDRERLRVALPGGERPGEDRVLGPAVVAGAPAVRGDERVGPGGDPDGPARIH